MFALGLDNGTFGADDLEFISRYCNLKLRRVFLDHNATHHAGLIASRVLGAPLKLDIFQTGLVDPQSIQDTIEHLGFNEPLSSQLLGIFLSKGTHASKTGFHKLWSQYGYV